ncbi:MAG: triphosphoribosyl-dephospho-CoA synthase MdcB [Rhodospirillales bacterium]
MRTDPLQLRNAPQGGGVGCEVAWPRCDLPPVVAEQVGELAAAALTAGLETWPKPGLVSPVDCGSHDDIDETTFRCSIAAIRPFYVRLAVAGAAGAGMDRLREIGRDAEAAMLVATGGVNTHRGAIFGLGLLCAAAGAAWAVRSSRPERSRPVSAADLAGIVHRRWGSGIRRGPIPLRSHGSDALRRFGAGGARAEAAAGFPHALRVGLPALQCGRAFAHGETAARVHAFFSLLAFVEDTNLLHRGGADGLRHAQRAARRFLSAAGVGQADWHAQAVAIHRAFVAKSLSPGGSADLLAVTIFLDRIGHDG